MLNHALRPVFYLLLILSFAWAGLAMPVRAVEQAWHASSPATPALDMQQTTNMHAMDMHTAAAHKGVGHGCCQPPCCDMAGCDGPYCLSQPTSLAWLARVVPVAIATHAPPPRTRRVDTLLRPPIA